MSKRPSREIVAEGFREIDERFAAIERKLDQVVTVLTDLADGLTEHRTHTMQDVSDMGAEVRELKTKVQRLEITRAGNGR